MVAEFSVYDTPLLAVEHLFDSEENESLISRFTAPNNAMGLESYLKNAAMDDERAGFARTYLVKDKQTGGACMLFHAQGRPDYHQSDAIRSKNLYCPLFDAWLSMWE